MTTATWDQVHVGDTVRGADQRVWEVVNREVGPRWMVAGAHDFFRLRLGDREVTTTRRLIDPAAMVARADHSAAAVAWQALASVFQLDPIGESMTDPFTAPEDGVKRDRYGRYLLPDPETGAEKAWTRVSTIARTLADMYNLHQWDKRNVVKGMGLRPDLVAGAAAADPEEDKGTLASIVKQAEDAAGARKGANLGTAFHQAAKRFDDGTPLKEIQLPAPIDADIAAYAEEMKRGGLKVLPGLMERIVIIPALGAAGTFDRVVSQPPGDSKSEPLSILDLKSGKDLTYGWFEIEIQQACYAHGALMWDREKRCYVEMPKVDQSRALVAWSPIGKGRTQILGVDLIRGWRYAQVAIDVRNGRKAAKGWLVKPDNPAAVALHLVSHASSQQELAALWDRYNPAGLWSQEVNEAAVARFASLATV